MRTKKGCVIAMNEGPEREAGFPRGLCEKRVNMEYAQTTCDLPPFGHRLFLSSSASDTESHFTMFQFTRYALPARLPVRLVRWNSTGPVLPPLMATLRTDLKTAMRAKDTTR